MLIDFPTELPVEAVPILVAILRRQTVDVREAVRVGYHVEGYALGKVFVAPPAPMMAGELSADQAADMLEQAVSMKGEAGSIQDELAKLPWGQILALLAQYLPVILPFFFRPKS